MTSQEVPQRQEVSKLPLGWADLLLPDEAQPPNQRVVLGLVPEGLVAGEALRPVLVLGPQRSRKTTGIVSPTLFEWDGPAIVTSVRSDVFATTYAHRRCAGRVWVFEPLRRMVGTAVTGWNPIDDCRGDWDGAIRTSRWLTDAGASYGLQDGGFWYSLAAELLAPMLFAAGNNGYSISDVVRWVAAEEEFELRSLLQATGNEHALASFEGMVGMENRARSSVYATLRSVLRAFAYSAVQEACSAKTAFSVDEFFDGQTNTLYLCAPPDEQEELAPLFTALVRRILREAYEREGQFEKPLLLLLDEAGNVAPLSNLPALASTAAGTGVQLVTAFHDISQMIGIYGESRAQTIVNNHSALLLLPGNRDPKTADLMRSLVDEGSHYMASGAFRQREPGTAVAIYEHLPAIDLKLRSASHDPYFEKLALAAEQTSRSHNIDPPVDPRGRRLRVIRGGNAGTAA